MARPNKGASHVDGLIGTRESKRRAKTILQTVSGELSVSEACDEIGVGPTHFANLRTQALQHLLDGLQPLPVGRRPRVQPASGREVAQQQRIEELEHENAILRARLELALLLSQAEVRRSKSAGQASATPRPPGAAGASP